MPTGRRHRAEPVVVELHRYVGSGAAQQLLHHLQVVPLLAADPELVSLDLRLHALGALAGELCWLGTTVAADSWTRLDDVLVPPGRPAAPGMTVVVPDRVPLDLPPGDPGTLDDVGVARVLAE